MVERPLPYIPYLDPDLHHDPMKTNRAGLIADLKGMIQADQSWIGLLSRIKEQAKGNPEFLTFCHDIITNQIFTMRLTWEEIEELCV